MYDETEIEDADIETMSPNINHDQLVAALTDIDYDVISERFVTIARAKLAISGVVDREECKDILREELDAAMLKIKRNIDIAINTIK